MLSVVSLFSAIVIHMGVALYTAAWVLRGILGLAPGATIMGVDALLVFITVLGVLTGIYTMVGGLLAVVWTESVQTILLLIGAVVITVVGYLKIGGWSALAQTLASHPHPLAAVPGSGPSTRRSRAPSRSRPTSPGARLTGRVAGRVGMLPATTANLGPGFDTLALALTRHIERIDPSYRT